MTEPIEAQLRTYFREVEADAVARGQRSRPSAPPDDERLLEPFEPSHDVVSPRRAGWLVTVAAGLVILAALLGLLGDESPDPDPATTPQAQAALSVAKTWFDALGDDDLDAPSRLFSNEAAPGRDDRLRQAAFHRGEGARYEMVACQVDDALSVTCTARFVSPVREALGAPPLLLTERLSILDGAITSVESTLEPDGADVDAGFRRWLEARHPDLVDVVLCCSGSSIEDAFVRGTERAVLGAEWATHLDAVDCTYDGRCRVLDAQHALRLVERWHEAYRSADLGGLMLAYPVGDDAFEAVGRDGQLRLAAWDLAQGSTNSEPVCVVIGDVGTTATVRCEFANEQPVRSQVGAGPVRVAETYLVAPQGIVSISQSWLDDWRTVNDPFEAWYASTHPDDIDIGIRTWSSIDDATAAGERRRTAAREWADWLRDAGCAFDDPCAAG